MKTNLLSPLHPILLAVLLGLQTCSSPAASPSGSELLEKGIYTEETKGDLDEAIAIYQQLVTEAKNSQSLGAQAQFRLAQCYLKKKRLAEANAAFEKLIHDFPGEKELVAKARERLPSELALDPVPWVDGERLQLNIKMAGGLDLGAAEYYSDLAEVGGRKIWRVGARMFAGARSYSMVEAEPASFRPLASRWKISVLGEAFTTYKPGEVEVRLAGAADPSIVKLDGTVFDNEEGMDLMRRLPLANGFKATLPIFTALGGAAPIPLGLEVVATEEVTVPAGKFQCFKTKLSIGQTFWLSTEAHRYLVKINAGAVIFELASISRRKPTDPVPFRDDELGVSLTAPPNWVIYRPKTRVDMKSQVILMLDPEADSGIAEVKLVPATSLSKEARESSRAWAEIELRDSVAKELKDVKIRPQSWRVQEAAGRPGASYIADFTENGKPRVVYALHVLGAKTAESFKLTGSPEKFEALRAGFQAIIASYQTTQ